MVRSKGVRGPQHLGPLRWTAIITDDRLLRWLISPFNSLRGISGAGCVRLGLSSRIGSTGGPLRLSIRHNYCLVNHLNTGERLLTSILQRATCKPASVIEDQVAIVQQRNPPHV